MAAGAHPIAEFDSAAELRDAVTAGRVRWVVLRRRDLDGLGLPFRVAADETTFPGASAEGVEPKAGAEYP